MSARVSPITLRVRRIDMALPLPEYAHPGDAGLDLYASQDLTLPPGGRALVATGIAVAIPEGHAGFVLPRSGRAVAEGLSVVNAPGLIDSQYRGELKVIALNTDSSSDIHIAHGEKIAQLVIQRVEQATILEVDDFDPTVRGESGFGSTGR